MLKQDIAETLGEIWNDGSAEAQQEFAEHMKGKQYGHEPLRDAWLWFLTGWESNS